MSCGGGCRHGSDPALLWLWCRWEAAALIRLLGWEHPHATGAALERQKDRERKEERKKGRRKEGKKEGRKGERERKERKKEGRKEEKRKEGSDKLGIWD